MSEFHGIDTPDTPPELPLTYRRELTPQIFRALQSQRSCALVGLRGAGLSNLLRFIAEPRVIASYLNSNSAHALPVYLETGWLNQPDDLCREIIRQIYHAAQQAQYAKADLALLRYLDQQAGQLPPPDREELLSQALAHLCRAPQRRLILLLDEFDQLCVQLPVAALRRLRQWRDAHKQALCYVVGTNRELLRLVEQRADHGEALDKFTELFDEQTYPVGPYQSADAQTLLARKLFNQPSRPLPDDEVRLYRLTGGHATLLIAALRVWEERQHLAWPQIERAILQDTVVRERCAGIWHELAAYEQTALVALAAERRGDVPAEVLNLLRLKGLVIGRPPSLFAIAFESFVRAQTVNAATGALPARLSRLRNPVPDIQW